MTTTAYTRRVLIIVPAADRDRANLRALDFDPDGGDRTFETPLSGDGQAPATHYCCCTAMREAVFSAVSGIVAGEFPGSTMTECSVEDPQTSPAALFNRMALAVVGAGLR